MTSNPPRRHAAGGWSIGLALAALMAVWLASLLLYCFFQAGTYGVLTAAERQALPGLRRQRDFFRTFTLRDFRGWGGRYVQRVLDRG